MAELGSTACLLRSPRRVKNPRRNFSTHVERHVSHGWVGSRLALAAVADSKTSPWRKASPAHRGTSPPTPFREHRQRLLLLHPLPSLSSIFWVFISTRLPEFSCAVQHGVHPDTSLTASHSSAAVWLPRRQRSPTPSAAAPHRSPGPEEHSITAGPALGAVLAAQQGLLPGSLAQCSTGHEPMDLEERDAGPASAGELSWASAGPSLQPQHGPCAQQTWSLV